MFIKQFKYSRDNLGYLVYSVNEGVVIDGGAVQEIMSFVQNSNIKIKYVANTHSHYDHTPGNEKLLNNRESQFIDCTKIKSDQTLHLDSEKLKIWHTPGHTDDSVVFMADSFLVTGDTLFNGTIGNCFSGDLNAFFLSLKRLTALPAETQIYSGHDYVMESVQIAQTIEPDNLFIKEYIKKYNPELVVSSIEDELKVNPFLRFNSPDMINQLKQRNMPLSTEFERFNSIMEIF